MDTDFDRLCTFHLTFQKEKKNEYLFFIYYNETLWLKYVAFLFNNLLVQFKNHKPDTYN